MIKYKKIKIKYIWEFELTQSKKKNNSMIFIELNHYFNLYLTNIFVFGKICNLDPAN